MIQITYYNILKMEDYKENLKIAQNLKVLAEDIENLKAL